MVNLFSINSPFASAVNKLVQMIWVGILWFVCSIPLVTVGAATTALYEVLLKMEKNQEGYLGISFLRAFRENIKNATLVWIPLFAAEIVFGVNLFYYAVFGGSSFRVQSVVFAVLLLVVVTLSSYAFPVLARFENTTAGTLRMAAVLAVRNPGWTALILFVQILTIVVCWFFLYFPVLFITGITGYFQAVIFNHIFDKLIAEGKIVETSHAAGQTDQTGEKDKICFEEG
ncbi:MAG: YesL family protein [Lachnospiraceae bacterium]